MANYQNNYTSNFEGQDPAGDAGLSLFLNGAEYTYHPSGSDTTVYIPTVEKYAHDYVNIVYAITRVLAAGGSPVVTMNGAEFTYVNGDVSEYKFTNVSANMIVEMTINRSTGTVTTRNSLLDSSEVEAGDSSISVQKTVDPDTGAETFTVSVSDEGITNDKIAPATIQPDRLAKKKQISVDGVTIVATPVSDDEVELSAVIPSTKEVLEVPSSTVYYDGQTATVDVPCEDGKEYSLGFDVSSLSSVTLNIDSGAGETVDGPTRHCYLCLRNLGSGGCHDVDISFTAPDTLPYHITQTVGTSDRYLYDVYARLTSVGTIAIVKLIGWA